MAKRENGILTKVRNNILENNLIENNDVIVMGLSGGPDSVFLLYSLNYLKEIFRTKYNIEYAVIVCHVNHMIRKEAKDDELLAKKYAEKLGFKFYSLEAEVSKISKEKKISEEECGRDIRYKFFEKILKENNGTKIAVAHNANDNAETVIHNFIRGTGLNGLSGIKFVNGKIIRPLLNIEKKDIVKYLDENNIEYNVDKTNLKNDYTRNKIRNDLIKKIEDEYNPSLVKSINRMSKNISEDINYISYMAKEEYEKIVIKREKDSVVLNINEFKNMNIAIQKRVVLNAINDIIGTVKGIEDKHIEDICDILRKSITGKSFSIGTKFSIQIEKNKRAKLLKKWCQIMRNESFGKNLKSYVKYDKVKQVK